MHDRPSLFPVPLRVLALLALSAVLLAGCSDKEEKTTQTQEAPNAQKTKKRAKPEEQPLQAVEPGVRIVSLSPALTQILIDMGQRGTLVGRTRFAPPGVESVPIVGNLREPNFERISAVSPDLLLVQPPAEGIGLELRLLARAQECQILAWRIDRLSDIKRVVDELPDVLARFGGDATHARAAGAVWRTRMASLLVPNQSVAQAGSVLMLFAVDPPAAFGEATYLDDLLRALGGHNAIQRPGYPLLSLEDLLALAPDSIFVIAPDEHTARAQARSLRRRLGPAGQHLPIIPVDGKDLLVPGTRLLEGAEVFKRAFTEGVQ